MMCRVRAPLACVLAAASAAFAVPAEAAIKIKLTADNSVPACATPGRLMSFLENRNGKLDDKFSTIAADYMRIGEDLKIRWDVAFFQMLLETGNLTFTGDVDQSQNNFAGLGATGHHESGERFPDVATGVKAHLQHILMYAGETISDPAAERTRKVQEWGVLTSWQKTISGPMTYTDLARKWAPGSKSYARDIEGISEAFYNGACTKPDPKPGMIALAKPGATLSKSKAKTEVAAAVATDDISAAPGETAQPSKGAELARRANEEARSSGAYTRSALGATALAPAASSANAASLAAAATEPPPAVTILNAPKAEPAAEPSSAPASDTTAKAPEAKVQTASFGAGLLTALGIRSAEKKGAEEKPAEKTASKPAQGSTCKVWTASYGGSHAVIIRASADAQDNFTVLDVNEGSEKREAEAYIQAYAKGGQMLGEFSSSSQALDKAFELCPEG